MRAAGGTNTLLPEPSTSTSAATSGLPQDGEDTCVPPTGNTEEVAVKGPTHANPLSTQRAKGAASEPSGAEQPASSSVKGSAVYRYSIEDLKLMKEFPSSKLPMDPKSQLAQIMSKLNSTRRNDGYKGGINRSFGNDDMTYHPTGNSHPNIESQGSLLGMPGNLRPSGSLVSKAVAANPTPTSGASTEGLIANNKILPTNDKPQDSTEASSHTSGSGQLPSTRAPPATARQTSGFPPPPPPPEKEGEAEAANGGSAGFLSASATNKQVDTTLERPPSMNLMSSSALQSDLWAPQQQQKPIRPVLPPTNPLAHDLLFHPAPKPLDLFGPNRMTGDSGVAASPTDVPPMEQPPPVYDYYNRYGDQMHQHYTTTGLNLWNGQEHDLWDSPVEGGDNDIFTLGDIRQAEHTIETQGISAESYANLRTRKIFSDVADRSKPPQVDTEASQDLFFFDNNSQLAAGDQRGAGESRFLGMFEANQQQQQQQVNQRMPMRSSYQPQAASMNNNYMYQPQQQVPPASVTGQWNGTPTSAAPTTGMDRSPDKAMMREHLLKILGLKSGADGKPVQAPPQEVLYKQHQTQSAQQSQSIYPPMGTAAPTRPSNTIFSRPLNPAAPQFSPLGIFNNIGTNDSHSIKKSLAGIPPPPPPTDYRRQVGLYDHLQAAQGLHQMPPSSLMWNQRSMNPQQHPMDSNLPQDVDLSQRLAAKAIPKQQQTPQQTPPITEQQAVAAAQFLQRHLMANANLTPEQIQQVMQFFNKNKSTLLASQLLLANQNAARRKEFDSETMTKEQQAAALLHSAANQFRQQSAVNNANKLAMPPQMTQAQPMAQPTSQLSNANSQLQSQIQAVHKALQASVARAQAGARGGHTAQEMQRLVSTLQQLQQKSTLLQQQQQQQQQQAMLSQQMPRRPHGANPGQLGASPVLNAQQQQKYQQQVCIANAIEQLTAMAHRIKTQQQQQNQAGGVSQPDMSPQQLLTAAQKQLQHKQAQQQQQGQHPYASAGGHMYDQHQIAQRNTSTPSNELKQQLTSALTATIQQSPNKSEQAAANLSALLKNLPPNHNLSQQIHAMLAQQQQQQQAAAANSNLRSSAHTPGGSGPSIDESAAGRFASQLLKSDITSKPSEGTSGSGNGFKSSSAATEVDGPPGEGSDKENGLNPSPAAPSSTTATVDMVNASNEVMEHKNLNRGDTNEQRLASSTD